MNDHFPPPSALPAGSKVWAYVRDNGAYAPGHSTTDQQTVIEQYCQQYSLELSHVFADVSKSGNCANNRPAFMEMIEKSSQPDLHPDGLLMLNFARFSRNLHELFYYKSLLMKNGIVIHSLSEPNITEESSNMLLEYLIDHLQMEKRMELSIDTKRGMQALFVQGYSFGIPPRGYLREQTMIKTHQKEHTVSRWIPDPQLWDTVRKAWQLRAEGYSYKDIQKATGSLIYKSHKSWPACFRNKTYLGIGIWGDLEVPNHHPAAIEQEIWVAVQQFDK